MGVQPQRALPSGIPPRAQPGARLRAHRPASAAAGALGLGRGALQSCLDLAPPAAIRRALWSRWCLPHPIPLAPSVVCSPSAERAGGWGTGRQCAEHGGGPSRENGPLGWRMGPAHKSLQTEQTRCCRTPSRAEALLSSWPGQRGPRWTPTLVPSTQVGNAPQPCACPTPSPPGTVPFPHAGHGISPAPAGWRFPPRQLPGSSPLLRPGVLLVWAAPALAVEVPEHAVVDLAGDLLLLQHLLDGLPGRASLDRLPSLARLLGLDGNTTLRFL